MKNAYLSMMSLVALASQSAHSATAADEVKSLRAEIASNRVDRTTKCRWYQAWYIDQCTKEEREAILERNIAAHRRWIELAGKNGADPKGSAMQRAELGKVLEVGGRWEEAEKELTEALKYDFDKTKTAEARWALAECLWHRKDKDGAKKIIAEIAAMDWRDNPSPAWHKAFHLHKAWTDPDWEIDAFKLPHSTDGKPFPVPQEAKYGEGRVSLAKVEIKFRTDGTSGTDGTRDASRTSPARSDDPIVRLLKRKLENFGAKFEKNGTKITIEISPDAPVDKPQGYELRVRGLGGLDGLGGSGGLVSIKARDRLGATWGVVSFLQCVDRGETPKPSKPLNHELTKPSIRTLRIEDWPKCERRGVIAYWYKEHLEYSLFLKMSSVISHVMTPWTECSLLFSPLERERCRMVVKRYADFGIDFCWSERQLTVSPVLPLSSKRTHDMYLSWMRCAAMIGASFCFEMDDERFWPITLHPMDVKAAGSATNLDAKFLTGLYREVKAEHPNFRMTFGPPFYFGPDGGRSKTWYPEPRDPYLKSIGEFLDPEIDVYWTGPRVKSYGFTPEKIAWYSNLIGRKPVIYHNSDCVGRHSHYSYGVDVPAYKKSHCRETFDLTVGFYMNTSRFESACAVGPAMDWCWNPEAHDDAESCRRTIDMLEGPGVFDIITKAMPAISYFDRYALGQPRSELFLENQADLDGRIAECDKAWAEAKATGKNGGRFVGGFNNPGLYWAKRIANYLRDPPKWLLEKRDAEKKNTKFAKKDVGFDEAKGDIFIPAELMQGGIYNPEQDDYSRRGYRGIKYVKPGQDVRMSFDCELFPPERPPRAIICAMGTQPDMEIEVNGRVIRHERMFISHWFKPYEIEMPVDALRRYGNKLVIRNVSPQSEDPRKPLVHYVVIRR